MASDQSVAVASQRFSQVAGNAFVQRFYHILHQSPQLVHRFYQENNKLGRPDPSGAIDSVTAVKEFSSKQGYVAQSLSAEKTTTGAPYKCKMKFLDGAVTDKSQSTTQKGNSGVEHCKVSETCLMSSSIDYGCWDDYPYNPDNRYPHPPSYTIRDECW